MQKIFLIYFYVRNIFILLFSNTKLYKKIIIHNILFFKIFKGILRRMVGEERVIPKGEGEDGGVDGGGERWGAAGGGRERVGARPLPLGSILAENGKILSIKRPL